MLSQKNDLADMISIMRELPINRLDYGVILSANPDGPHEIVWLQRSNSIKNPLPTMLPISEQVGSRGARQHLKFHVAVAFGLFAVGRQKVGPARDHIPGHVLYVNGDAVRFFIECAEEVFVADLPKRPFRECFVIAKSFDRVGEIILSRCLFGHGSFVPSGTIDNSPAIHGWVRVDLIYPSPEGTTENPNAFCRPFGTRNQKIHRPLPAINRWAIFDRPSGTHDFVASRIALT